MASSQDDSEWDKSTSEIQSEDSDDLFASRPNRWRGPPQSWRTLTEEDRLTFTALERLRNQDLSVHLYNAFALKHPAIRRSEPWQLGEAAAPDAAASRPWAPPKSWTAWPLQARLVPPDDFMKRTEDEDEEFTFRRIERQTPGGQLEEVLSAAILRCAKERFRKRQLDGTTQQLAEGEKTVKREPVSSGEDVVSSAPESDGEEEDRDIPGKSPRKRHLAVEKTYKPAFAIDDDVSYALIRPSTRAILSKLDQTLTILRNACATSSRHTMDAASSPSASETENDIYNEAAPSEHRSRSRSRSRSRAEPQSQSRDTSVASTERSLSRDASPSKPQPNRGRKATSLPREGESERDFLVRRAREQKKKRPVFSDADDAGADTDAMPPSRRRRRHTRGRRNKTADGGDDQFWMQRKLDRFHLRDWSDVMGAAALAGFNAEVIDRATQRCANLFGQGMEMHTIDEDTGVSTRRYVPGRVGLSSESEDEDGTEVRQSRATSRHSSLAHSRAVSLASGSDRHDEDDDDDDEEREPRGAGPANKRRRRSSSLGSILESCYCHHADCERSTRSFAKPFNLRRHLETVHGESSTPRPRTPQPRTPPQADATFYCTHADCERATRPFDKGHNLRRHLERVHGKALEMGRQVSDKPAVVQHFCPHAGCERATRGFDRNPNLVRHLELVHGEGKSRDRGEGSQNPLPERVQDGGSGDAGAEDETGSESESGIESE